MSHDVTDSKSEAARNWNTRHRASAAIDSLARSWRRYKNIEREETYERTQMQRLLLGARAAGWSQAAIGNELGISQQRVAQLETKARKEQQT